MANAISAFGTLLKQGDGGGPETFTTIAEVRSISGPSMSGEQTDVTNHSTSTPWREFISSLLDAGEVSFEINYIPTEGTHDASTGLLKDFKDRTERNWQLVFPDGGSTTWTFAGFVSGFEVDAPVDAQLSASVTIKLTGEPTLA